MNQLHKPKLELSETTDPDTNEVLHFAFRGETIQSVLKEFDLATVRGFMDTWKAIPPDGEALIILTGPYIEEKEIRALLPHLKALEKIGEA